MLLFIDSIVLLGTIYESYYTCGVTAPINRIYPLWGASPSRFIGSSPSVGMSSSGTHMVAPEAYKPYVGGNSSRCGTCDYNYKVPFNVGTLPQLIGFIRFGEPVPHGLSARHRVWAGPTKG